jgi:gluconate 2-dehydrogenase gamma chain
MADQQPVRLLSRRDLLKGAGAVGAAAIAGSSELLTPAEAAPAELDAVQGAARAAAAAPAREAFETLSASEADVLEAIVARLIPSDAQGPGAKEARAAHYIDRALGGALKESREAYRSGLAALDRYAQGSRGKPFTQLAATDQDSLLTEVQSGAASKSAAGFSGSSTQFFNLVRGHTWQGTFGDPYYGGNADFVGWDLVGYPGVRTMVTAADQQAMEKGQLKPNHRSAYDSEMFNKATVQARPDGDGHGHEA